MAGCLLLLAVFFSGCAIYTAGAVGPGVDAGLAEAGVAAADISVAAAPVDFWGGWGGSFQQNNYDNYNRLGPHRHWHGGRYRGGFRDGFRR
jgi:hypothetical protein